MEHFITRSIFFLFYCARRNRFHYSDLSWMKIFVEFIYCSYTGIKTVTYTQSMPLKPPHPLMGRLKSIRTVNGRKHNPMSPSKHWKIQNRTAAIVDIWDEHGSSTSLHLVAHLHRISAAQITNDIFADLLDIKTKVGVKDWK